MKRYQVFIGLAASLMVSHITAGAQPLHRGTKQSAWELGAFGGYYVMEGNQWLKDAPGVGGKVGYFFTEDLQLQFLFNYNPSDLEPPFSVVLGGRSGSVDLYHYRAEMFYHVPIGAGFVP